MLFIVTDAEVSSVAPIPTDTGKSDMAGRLLGFAFWCALGGLCLGIEGWTPLQTVSGVVFCACAWIFLLDEQRAEKHGERLFIAAWLCALGGWLPAISGYGWHLLVMSGVCFGASCWVMVRDEGRTERKRTEELSEKLAENEAARRPLSRIVAAEREVLARRRTAP